MVCNGSTCAGTTHLMKHAFAALALFATSGCLTLEGPEPELEAIALRPDPGDPSCPSWGCGANSATVGDGLVFDEIDSSGIGANRGGMKYLFAKFDDDAHAHAQVRLYAYRHWLYAYSLDWSQFYWGADLVNLVLTLNHPVNGNYEVKINKYDEKSLKFWAGTDEAVPFYELKTRHEGAPQFIDFACRNLLQDDPMWAGMPQRAVIFQGDRYDATTKTARDVGDYDPWFNIACAATAPAKMHLMRHTRAGGNYTWWGSASYPTSDGDRTALLKMFTADYCGTGHTFTVDGQPLAYQDKPHWKPAMESYTTVEALWTAAGASCLKEPRWVDRNMVFTQCGYVIPSCPSPITGWESSGAHVFSANR